MSEPVTKKSQFAIVYQTFLKRQPWMIVSVILGVVIALEVINAALLRKYPLETPEKWFPISELYGPRIHPGLLGGLPYALIFLAVGLGALWFIKRLKPAVVMAVCCFLLLAGNMIQGNYVQAFVKPFTDGNTEYYFDALEIKDSGAWLRDFNNEQPDLRVHSRTHPPFAVLLQRLLLVDDHIRYLIAGFLALVFLQFPLLWLLVRRITHSEEKASLAILLYALLPAVNIYSVMSLDGVIATFFLAALVGLFSAHEKLSAVNVLVYLVGLIGVNALTFAGSFLFAIPATLGAYFAFSKKKFNLLIVLGIGVLISVLLYFLLLWGFNYDHVRAFFTASRIENPEGFRLLSNPYGFIATRIENMAVILFFAGLGGPALWIQAVFVEKTVIDRKVIFFAAAGTGVLLVMFLTGAFRTGETARACLFIYPYLLLPILDTSPTTLKDMGAWALVQTAFMQMFASYGW